MSRERVRVLRFHAPRLLVAYRNLKRTRLRSALAILAVAIGVTAVGGMGLFGTTLQYSVGQSTADLANEVVVTPQTDGISAIAGETATLTRRRVRSIERIADGATVVRMRSRGRQSIAYRGITQRHTVYEIRHPNRLFEAIEGEIPSQLRGGAIVGRTAAETLGIEPGTTIRVGGDTVSVRGVFDRASPPGVARPINSAVVLGPSAETEGYSHVVLLVGNSRRATRLERRIETGLNERKRHVRVSTRSGTARAISGVFTAIQTALMGVASIALLVAGVGILNIMFMSTIERREEIGVLRAVGFGKRDVLAVVLAEAVFLGIVGGLLGALLSVGVGMVVNQVMIGHPLRGFLPRSALYVALAFGTGVLASLIGGLYPARKAANDPPVEALREG